MASSLTHSHAIQSSHAQSERCPQVATCPLDDLVAAVDVQQVAVDVGGVVRGEEQVRAGDLVGGRHPVHRDGRLDVLVAQVRQVVQPTVVDEAELAVGLIDDVLGAGDPRAAPASLADACTILRDGTADECLWSTTTERTR